MNETVDPFRDWDAAYVLGALSAEDRRAFERHLANCPACEAAVAELAGIPGILTKIDANTAVALASAPKMEQPRDWHYEPDLVQRLARSARRRRRGLTAGLTAAAALLIVVGILTGRAIHPTTKLASGPTGTVVTMAQVQPNAMTADLRVTSKPWGTRFDWSCAYGSAWAPNSAPQAYNLVITDASGVKTVVATWSSTDSSAEGLAASSSIPIADIKTIEIRAAGAATPLVRGQL